jgi:hypothetical protein
MGSMCFLTRLVLDQLGWFCNVNWQRRQLSYAIGLVGLISIHIGINVDLRVTSMKV